MISLGLSERQQNGMRLCESAIYSFRSALFSFLIASVLYIPVYLFLMKGMLWEGFSAPGSNLYDLNTPETVADVMTHVLHIIGLSAGVVAVVTAVVFLLFLAAVIKAVDKVVAVGAAVAVNAYEQLVDQR